MTELDPAEQRAFAQAVGPVAVGRRLALPRIDGLTWLFVGPLFLVLLAFMVLPAFSVLVGAVRGEGGHFTTKYLAMLGQAQYVTALKNTVLVSFWSALLGAVLGAALAWVALGPHSPPWIRRPLMSFSGVASNFAGIPLALAFLMTLSGTGVITKLLLAVGINLQALGFSLFSLPGLVLVYLYFQIPLMVILFTPAINGLRQEWQEAAENLGAGPWLYWRRVGLPILMPSLLACATMLFGNAFATYATPYALTSGNIPLLPLQISAVMSGNVLSDPQLGQALALLIIVIMLITTALYVWFDKQSSRWRV
ncbi:putative spermidine/putrescine transport system permease protein [Deinococcus metalli]|uniref:ABC transporter n=1 Tax=Deinococcus metalli TaxID=1141878 RepID=A0A7W8KGS1_9DEIO|nr:ABC transporter permease subunit [Deinococcus metalli]MBB5376823.1 putative spermidine/putrescine transport system permease protein [Deinococcus metalli]GHF45621.1 ABC transporter [Deinococcus metalli]